ncbi:MAG: hypothetical protein MHPSP_000161, partial [Paramarteilia canceri]
METKFTNKSESNDKIDKKSTNCYRKRTRFSNSQLKILKLNFLASSYLSGDQIQSLSENLGLSQKSIK